MQQRLWTRDELILAINLYCKLPFGKLHKGNADVIKLSELIGRTPSAVAWKLVNFASFDPSLRARGIKGASNASNLDRQIWEEFYGDWSALAYESESLLAKIQHKTIEELHSSDIDESAEIMKKGVTRETLVKVRVNQSFFRQAVLAAYEGTCCITGLSQPELLVASHIKPWSVDQHNRLNPRNGLCLNALHDKAFDTGLITITPDYKVQLSSSLRTKPDNPPWSCLFLDYDQQSIRLPSRFFPDPEFLKYHNREVFIR